MFNNNNNNGQEVKTVCTIAVSISRNGNNVMMHVVHCALDTDCFLFFVCNISASIDRFSIIIVVTGFHVLMNIWHYCLVAIMHHMQREWPIVVVVVAAFEFFAAGLLM